MALSGVVKEEICNGLIVFSAEWRAEQDILNSTNTYHYDIYIDTSKCASAKTNADIIRFEATGVGRCDISIGSWTRLDTPAKKKVASLKSEPIKAYESDSTLTIVEFYCLGNWHAYTDLITYVEDGMSHNDFDPVSFTVSGITSVTIGEGYGDHILGNEQTLTLTRKRTEFTHKVEYSCGTASGLLLDNSTTENFPVILPISLASQNTTGTTVSVTLKVTTFYSGQAIGEKTKTFVFTIPESVKPLCVFEVTDGTLRDGQQIKDIYGGYVREKSRFKIVVSAVEAYGSRIVKYTINANDKVFDEQSIITNLIKNAGENKITVTVTDERGRTSDAAVEVVNVLPYKNPVVTAVSAMRYTKNESDEWVQDRDGEYIKVFFSAEVTPIDGRNSAAYFVSHQMSSGLEPYTNQITEYDDIYQVENGEYIFEAKKGVDYTVTVHAKDDFGESLPKSSGGVATTILMHLLANGLGLCFGGLGTIDNCFENKFLTYPSGGFMFPALEAGVDLFDTKPNVYICENPDDYAYMPEDLTGGFVLIVLPLGGSVKNVVHIIISQVPKIYMRAHIGAEASINPWKSLTLS
jgi:hypothetical protein